MDPTTSVTDDHIWGVLGGHDVVCGVVNPCQTWSIPHITLIGKCDSISIPVSSSLDNYTTDGGTWFKLLNTTTSVTDDHAGV